MDSPVQLNVYACLEFSHLFKVTHSSRDYGCYTYPEDEGYQEKDEPVTDEVGVVPVKVGFYWLVLEHQFEIGSVLDFDEIEGIIFLNVLALFPHIILIVNKCRWK